MLVIKYLKVLHAGKEEFLRLLKANCVFAVVLNTLVLIPLDLHVSML